MKTEVAGGTRRTVAVREWTCCRRQGVAPDLAIGLAMCLLALAVRVPALGSLDLSTDEGTSIERSTSAAPIDAIADNVHAPLYWFLLRIWIATFGSSAEAIRWPSVIAGTVGVLLVYAIAHRLGGRRVGVVAAVLVALSPTEVFFSRDARPHIFHATFALAATWSLFHALARSGQSRWWGAYVASVALLVSTSYLAMYTLASHAVGVMGTRFHRLRRWAKSTAAGMAPLGIWFLLVGLRPVEATQELMFDRSHEGTMIDRWLADAREFLHVLTDGYNMADQMVLPMVGLVLAGPVAAIALGRLGWPRRTETVTLAAWVLCGAAFFGVTGALGGNFHARYILPLVAPVAIGLALSVMRLPTPWRWLATAGLLVGWVWNLPGVYSMPKNF